MQGTHNNSFEQWESEGCLDTTERALAYAKRQLAEYQQPRLEEAADEALLDFIARRERELPGDVL